MRCLSVRNLASLGIWLRNRDSTRLSLAAPKPTAEHVGERRIFDRDDHLAT
jgi:hypothetical protein